MAEQKIIQGDCLEVMKTFADKSFDLVLTDPPYKGYNYEWGDIELTELPEWLLDLHGLWFWSKTDFPLDFTARHIWSKANRNIGKNAELYEEIYERNGGTTGLVFRYAVIDSDMNAQINSDLFFKHPTQKPLSLIKHLIKKFTKEGDTILDPFMGSGTTLVAAKQLNRNAVGIEISPQYCKIAQDRLNAQPNSLFAPTN